ncbi:GNAT family N-acetyltransferase [Pedobacter sp. ASV1-7]|uniref:GNAT family N-acetyltransferase n=1 Tax=Pedobacter sp. ASV1-7 TaxID=3145237 RepID=UPI0032E8DE7F
MKFIQSTHQDIDGIFQLYNYATTYQGEVGTLKWQGFERSMVEKTIDQHLQWQIMLDDELACVFTLTLNDPLIWEEKDKDPAIYIHRIATNPKFRGKHFVKHIVEWVKKYALENGKLYVRMDTGSGNERLNNYYISCGFNYLGVVKLKNTAGLPKHYQDGSFSLFEIKLS